MSGKVILVNITANEVPLSDLGISISGNSSREVYTSPLESEYSLDTLRNSPSLYSAINENYIRINNGTLLFNREDSLDYLNPMSKQDVEYHLSRSFEFSGLVEIQRDTDSTVNTVKYYTDATKTVLIREVIIGRDDLKNVTSVTDNLYVNGTIVKTNTTVITRTDNNVTNIQEVIT